MIQRILFAYIGAILFPIIFLPIAIFNTMGGHSLVITVMFSSPLGLLSGLLFSDFRRRFKGVAIFTRTLFSLILFVGYFFVIANIKISPFFANNGWLLIPIGGPLFVAVISEFVLKKKWQQSLNIMSRHSGKNGIVCPRALLCSNHQLSFIIYQWKFNLPKQY